MQLDLLDAAPSCGSDSIPACWCGRSDVYVATGPAVGSRHSIASLSSYALPDGRFWAYRVVCRGCGLRGPDARTRALSVARWDAFPARFAGVRP